MKKSKDKSNDADDIIEDIIYEMPGIDQEELEFIQDNEGKLSTLEMENILDIKIKHTDEHERYIIKRCEEVYKALQECKDVDVYQKLCAEYAVLSMKAERILNRNDNAKARCIAETQYHRVDNKIQ